jgi:hypothetical protein
MHGKRDYIGSNIVFALQHNRMRDRIGIVRAFIHIRM